MAAAGIAVSVTMGVMKPVLEKLSTLMGDEYKKIKGLRKEVSFLRDELRDMETLLEKMDAADRLDSQAKEWRKDIIDMSYDIEDCIDDFMHRVGEPHDKVGSLQKASSFLRTIKDRYRIAKQINKIKTRVIQTSQRRERYKLDVSNSTPTPVVVDPRLSALYMDSATLVGLENQKEELVKWIMDEEQQLKVMSIVGFGGLGKTTLANEVLHQVEGKFVHKTLICVSQKPDISKLLKRILLGLGQQQYSQMACCAEQDLVSALRKHLQDKRYFIIIDDLWETEAWDVIQWAFPQNNQRCRVMITTRDEKVARRCCSNDDFIYNMKPLSEPDSRKLFFTRIFGSEHGCHLGFEEVSRAILKRCGGLPLAIITIAGIIASQRTKVKEAWDYIQNALAPEMETNIDYEKMMYILDLSYKSLPRHLKACFLYLGTYPEDHKINREELVRRWVAEGFVSNCAGLNVWDVADSYFNELVNRSMIQQIYYEYEYEYEYEYMMSRCRVHDMMLDLILRKCKEDNFLILVKDPREVAAEGQDKVIRRLTIDSKRLDDGRLVMTNVTGNLSHLRSLTILDLEGSKWIPLLLEFKFVQVLLLYFGFIGAVEMDFFGIINQLRHLRYLKVVGRGVIHNGAPLTTQIKGLQLLETLDLSGLLVEWKCPLDFVDLPRLSHLSLPNWSGIGLPRGIGEMKQLRSLCGFNLDQSSSESIIGLGELTALTELFLMFNPVDDGRDETVVSQWKPTWMASLSTSLEKLVKLRSLVVWTPSKIAHCADGRRLLFPRSVGSLERLHLWYWTFSIVPRWIGHLSSLKELSLGVKQIIQEDIGVLGILPSLVVLHLRIVHVPTARIVIGGGLFIAVKRFRFRCDEISSLTFEAGAMPNLGVLGLEFSTADWDRATPEGLQHLSALQKIDVYRACRPGEVLLRATPDPALVRGVFQDIADVLPTRPVFTFYQGLAFLRLKEFDPSEDP